MVNGNHIRHPLKINKLVESCWQIATGGTVWFPKHGYYSVRKNDTEALTALLLRVSYFAKRHSKESISKGIALSGTPHYAYLKKARRQTAKLRVEPASFAPAQEHCPLPGKLDALFAFPGVPDASPKPLLAANDNQIEEVLLLHMKALRRAAQRLMTFKNHLSANPFGKVSSKPSAHWKRHFERYYRFYWPCNISVTQYFRWYYLNPSTASHYLCNYPANLINPWLLEPWL